MSKLRTATTIVIAICCLMLMPPPSAHAGVGVWTTSGLEAASVRVLAVDPTAAGTLYAGTTGGGVFKSHDGAQEWSVAGTELQARSVSALAIDPRVAGTLYAGTDRGVFKTTDGGATWSARNEGLTSLSVHALSLDPRSVAILYAGTSRGGTFKSSGGVFKSSDGGDTWAFSGLADISVDDLLQDPDTPGAVYAATRQGLFSSPDGGQGWQRSVVCSGGANTLALQPTAPATLYVGCEGLGVFKSVDGGQSWVALNNIPQISQVWKLALDPAAPDTIYLATNGAGVFKSADGGQTWMDVNNGLPPLSRVDTFVAARGTVYSGTDGSGVFKTVDGGTNWIEMNHGLRAATVLAVAVDPVTPSTVYAGIAGGVFKSQDAGATWMAKNEGLTWPAGRVVEALAIDPMIPTTVYAVGGNGSSTVFKTGDGGRTWRAVFGPFDHFFALAIDPTTPSTLYVSLPVNGLDKSVDGGESWVHLDGGPPVAVIEVAVSPRTPGVVYTGTVDGVYRSDDGGASWTRASRGLPDSVSSIDGSVRTAEVHVLAFGPESPSTLYAMAAFYSDSGHFSSAVYRSTDGGETWTAAGRGLEDTFVNTLAADPVVPGRLFVGTEDGGVFLSEDAGTTWTAMSTGLTGAPVGDLALSTGSPATLWAATYGSGVFDFQLPRFADVSPASGFSAWIDALARAGVTAGCATQPPRYCLEANTTRAQMAILLLRSLNGPGATPPPATGTMFADVAATSFAAAWIEQLAALELSEGCGQGNYCPDEPVTRAQIATLLLRATHGRGYRPPPATGAVFQDVPATHPFAPWIEQLAREGITASCGTQPARYCPEDAVTRGQIAVFLVRAFHLPM